MRAANKFASSRVRLVTLSILLSFQISGLLPQHVGAQPPTPEIRGFIHEAGSDAGIPGVEVGLYKFGPNEQNVISRLLTATTVTGQDGRFSFKPAPLGDYMISLKKDGYLVENRGFNGTVTAERPVSEVSMGLQRPGSITGRVIDQDGNAAAKLKLLVHSAPLGFGSRTEVRTDAEGRFAAENLPPASYLIEILPEWEERFELLPYSEAEFETVDQNFETSYWPGGVSDPLQVLPIPLNGGIANAGTLTVRKVPYYRARIQFEGECAPNERWTFRIQPVAAAASERETGLTDQYGGCLKDFLITGLVPGDQKLLLWSGRDLRFWSVTPLTVTNRNVEARMIPRQPGSIPARVRMVSGEALPRSNSVINTNFVTNVAPVDRIPAQARPTPRDPDGRFEYPAIVGTTQQIWVNLGDPELYVKEILYNGLPLKSYQFEYAPGAALEIILERGAASVSGKAPASAAAPTKAVVLVRDGVESMGISAYQPFQFIGQSIATRQPEPGSPVNLISTDFRIVSIPPGDYRVLVADPRAEALPLAEWQARVARAEKITLRANEARVLELKETQ